MIWLVASCPFCGNAPHNPELAAAGTDAYERWRVETIKAVQESVCLWNKRVKR